MTWQTVLPITGYTREADLSTRVLARLEHWFIIEREVPGQHWSGRQLRIDAILRPREPQQWKNPNVALGVEFKRNTPGAYNVALKDATSMAAQAIDYTQTEWDGFGHISVFTCPGVMQWAGMDGHHADPREYAAVMYRHLLMQFGVGELVVKWGYGLTFHLGDQPIWNERQGVRHGKKWGLKPRVGSR
ncbi:hypothetical protein [Streptomyces neyagawaensis]|uniref:Uncharacterized protein n=1 Tax=Streptomyces neyagawaensis TaxID=42238 RepID=A0ABV3AZC6_9ACTN